MGRRSLISRICAALFATELVVGSVGCGQKDFSKYQPARNYKSAESGESPSTDSKPVPVSQPVTESPEVTEPAPLPKFTMADLPPVSALIPVNVVDGASIRGMVAAASGDNFPGSVSAVGAANSDAKLTGSSEPRKIELLIKDRSFRNDKRTGALLVNFEDLDMEKVLNMTKVTEDAKRLMPDWLTGLDGKTIRIRGFMVPTFVAEGIEQFVLARDNQACCFGPDPKIDYLAQVQLKPGKTTNYIPATVAFDVVGRFRIDIAGEQGKLFQMYFIEDAEILSK